MDEMSAGKGSFECGSDGPRVVLAAVDGSVTALRAGAYAAGMARRQHAELVILFVADHPALAGVAMGLGGAGMPEDYGNVAVASELGEQLKEAARCYGVESTLVVRHGDPVVEISALADEMRADSVVVGSSMWFGHKVLGSVAVRLVRMARWPVTVVP